MKLKHSFDLGELVTVFQMSPSKGLLIEGRAWVAKLEDMDEYYGVRFRDEKGRTVCTRFVDVEGQEDPVQYVIDTNKKIGMPRD